jgi:hypothetical protein
MSTLNVGAIDYTTGVAIKSQAVNTQSGTTYTFVAGDAGKLVSASNASAVTFTIPPQSSVTWGSNAVLKVVNYGAGALTVDGGSGVTVTNTATTVAQYSSAAAIRTAEDAWTLIPFGGDNNSYYVVVAGGGGGADYGGGGGGGYRSSVIGGDSGGGSSAETSFVLANGVHTLTVGAGGAYNGSNGSNSVFSTITALGGGGGGDLDAASSGGSGGGCADAGRGGVVGAGTANQGFAGALGASDAATYTSGGGGGGAAAVGSAASGTNAGNGGAGVLSPFTGEYYAGGGGGFAGGGSAGVGGIGGGGNQATAGSANTGGGGGAGAAGGSGIVLFTLPVYKTATFSGGVTYTRTTVSGNYLYRVTAAGPSDTVTIG